MTEKELLLEHLKHKGPGAYLSVLAGILAVAAMILYEGVLLQVQAPAVCLIAVFLIGVAEFFLEGEWTGWLTVAQSCLLVLAFMSSLNIMLDPIGYVVAGLYQYSDIAGYVTFGVVVGVALLCTLAGGFLKHQRAAE